MITDVSTRDVSTLRIDSRGLLDSLAKAMNEHPAEYGLLGWCDLDLGLVVHRPDDDGFRARICLRGYGCEAVADFPSGTEGDVDCWLEGDLAPWQSMLDDIVANGRATGLQTLSAQVLLGDKIHLRSADAMGADRFFRYNQTLQSFFDAAAAIGRPVAS